MITELRTLVAVARYGTFAAAGARIGLTQAAVSGQMKRLEDKLGMPLFDRTGRSATLNPVGHTVLARAGEVLALIENLAEPADWSSSTGRLRIGAISSVQPTLLKRALKAFHSAFPRFHIQVVPGTSLELLDRLDAGELELAVMVRPGFGLPQSLVWESLLEERFVLVTPPGMPVSHWQKTLNEQPFLRYSRHSFGGRQVERLLEQQGAGVIEWVEIDDIPALLSMVADGMGVAILPQAEAYADLFARVTVTELDEVGIVREIGILASPDRGEPITQLINACRKAGTNAA